LGTSSSRGRPFANRGHLRSQTVPRSRRSSLSSPREAAELSPIPLVIYRAATQVSPRLPLGRDHRLKLPLRHRHRPLDRAGLRSQPPDRSQPLPLPRFAGPTASSSTRMSRRRSSAGRLSLPPWAREKRAGPPKPARRPVNYLGDQSQREQRPGPTARTSINSKSSVPPPRMRFPTSVVINVAKAGRTDPRRTPSATKPVAGAPRRMG
jgi:hypothetical protein